MIKTITNIINKRKYKKAVEHANEFKAKTVLFVKASDADDDLKVEMIYYIVKTPVDKIMEAAMLYDDHTMAWPEPVKVFLRQFDTNGKIKGMENVTPLRKV